MSIDNAWAAGFIDGEGCFFASRNGKQISHYFSINCTCFAPLDYLHRAFGGSVYDQKSRGGNRKPSRLWQLSGKSLLPFLDVILPHLVVKRYEALLFAELTSTFRRSDGSLKFSRANHVPVEVQQRRIELMAALKEAKQDPNGHAIPLEYGTHTPGDDSKCL